MDNRGFMSELQLRLRSRHLAKDSAGYTVWKPRRRTVHWDPRRTALLACDVWDDHWCRGAVERLSQLVPRMDEVMRDARKAGVSIIHSPSETMPFYENSAARRRIQELAPAPLPASLAHPDPKLPIDDSDGGADTGETPWHRAWSRQHPGIHIDEKSDVISDNREEIWNFLRARDIQHLLVLGVHTNMCILHRPFGIKQMVRLGMDVALIRDLTDAMYNPERSPYVSHEEGTRLVVEFIERFWCPTLLSTDLAASK